MHRYPVERRDEVKEESNPSAAQIVEDLIVTGNGIHPG